MADIAIFRINYKSDFILTLNSDAGWMTPFCIKFWTGAPSQAFFVGWDGTTYTHCSYDPSEPTKLVVQFDDHHLPIGDLKFQIAYHFTVDDFPNDVEDEVLNQSNIVTEIDGNAYQVMLDFTGETAPEIQFSLPAYANEAQRIVNEQQRIAAEETRIDNEAQRIQNEETRINQEQARQDNEAQRIRNEQTRINQEEARVREFATLKRDAQESTTAANNAAALANQKAQLAADKAQLAADKAALAQDAANLANQKAQLAADKAALAQDAADLANQKAQLAQQKAEYAQSQGDYAKQQGDYAKEQGDYAKRKGDDAAAQMQQQAQAFSEAQAARQTSYEQAEGTESGSVAGDGSRWGAFKTNEAARDAKVDAKVADITNLQEAVAEGAVYDVSAKNPTAGPNNDGKWESLSALLSDANLNTLIPSAFRRGGMSIKFVLSSDNKYVQYRLMADEWSTNTENWAIADEGVYVENLEYIYVKTDDEGKILWAIRTDGSIYYGAGVPPQVIDYINKKIAEFSLDEYEDIVAFLNGIEFGDKTLPEYISEFSAKQTKLITDDNLEISNLVPEGYISVENITGKYSTCRIDTGIQCADNLEIECVFIDSNRTTYGSFFGRYTDEDTDALRLIYQMGSTGSYGLVSFNSIASSAVNVSGLTPNTKHHVILNKQRLVLDDVITTLNLTQHGSTQEGTIIINGVNLIAGSVTRTITWWNFIIRNTDGDVLFSGLPCKRLSDGAVGLYDQVTNSFFGNAMENNDVFTAGAEINNIKIKNSILLQSITNLNDKNDRLELKLDSEENIISYRDKEGILHEEAGIKTPVVNTPTIEGLSEDGFTTIANGLKEIGFTGGQGDWTDYLSNDGDNPLCIPEPRCAILNIISDFNLNNLNKKGYNASSQEGVNYDIPTQVEFWDMQGNYFKKWTLMSGQGSSSMGYTKKNIAFDFFDSEAGGDAFAIKFGDWVPQDSFHLKAYMVDFFKGLSVVSYKLAEQVAKTRPYLEDTVWKRGLYKDMDFTHNIFTTEQIDDMNLRLDNGAKCQPDGFPVIVYQNGAFHGIFAWMIKKHRDNYLMNKSNPNHIHLDGQYYTHKLFNGDLDWTTFEVRNPKNLVYASLQTDSETGDTTYKYDADIAQAEIAGNSDGSTSYDTWVAGTYAIGKIVEHNGHLFMNTVADNNVEPVYHSKNNADDAPDFKNKTGCGWLNVTNTVSVKEKIIALSSRLAEIHGADTTEEKKALAETYFDIPSLMDYELIQCAVADTDSIYNNCQWVTYDGIQWAACEYDKDDTFGNHTWACDVRSTGGWCQSALGSTGIATDNPVGIIRSYYQAEAKARWLELVNAGIFTTKNIINLTDDWIKRVGVGNYKKEYTKWDSRANRPTNINTDYWEYYGQIYNDSSPTYNSSTPYVAGDKVKLSAGSGLSFVFTCIQDCTGEAPCLDANTSNMGWKGSIGQLYEFIEDNLNVENEFFESL